MAFPTVESLTETSGDASGGSSLDIDLPATISSGDLLLMLVAAETLTAPSWTTPAGWTALQTGQINGDDAAAIFYKSASGSETSPVSVAVGANADGFAGQVFRISGWEGTSSGIAAATAVEGFSSPLDPPASPSMTAGGGDNLFIVASLMADDNDTVTSTSTNYGNLTNTVSANASINQGATVATWRRNLASSSDDPDSVTLSRGENHRATTIVVGEAGAVPPPPPPPALLAETSQAASLAATVGNNPAHTSLFAALVMNVGPASEEQSTSQLATAAAVNTDLTTPETSQIVELVAYGVGVPERNDQRAWFFDLDGHTNYVLDLGTSRTLVYDLFTEQWAQWRTEGYPIWNAQLGINWEDRIVAADLISPAIFEIDPQGSLDEGFRAVRREVTGILPSASRNYTALDALYVMASVGDAQTDFAGTAEMTLSFSDDQGQSFYEFGVEVLSSTDNDQELIYRSLGSYNMPGRIVKIEDVGGPVRIDSAQVVLR